MRRLQKIPFSITTAGTNFLTGNTTTPALSGYLRGIKVKSTAAVEGAATLATTIADDDGDLLPVATGFGTQAANGTVKQFADTQSAPNQLEYPVAGKLTITGTLSANQTVARVITGFLYVDSLI